MSELANENLSVREYNRISQYKDLEIEIEKCGILAYRASNSGSPSVTKKGTGKHLNNIHAVPVDME